MNVSDGCIEYGIAKNEASYVVALLCVLFSENFENFCTRFFFKEKFLEKEVCRLHAIHKWII